MVAEATPITSRDEAKAANPNLIPARTHDRHTSPWLPTTADRGSFAGRGTTESPRSRRRSATCVRLVAEPHTCVRHAGHASGQRAADSRRSSGVSLLELVVGRKSSDLRCDNYHGKRTDILSKDSSGGTDGTHRIATSEVDRPCVAVGVVSVVGPVPRPRSARCLRRVGSLSRRCRPGSPTDPP